MSPLRRLAAVFVVALAASSCGSDVPPTGDDASGAQAGSTSAAVDVADLGTDDSVSSVTTDTSTTTTTEAPLPFVDACTTERRPGVGVRSDTVVSGGNDYVVQWTVPSSYDGQPLPVVIDFHGIGSNGAQQSVFSGLSALAETEGFIAVHPTGLATPADDRNSWEFEPFDIDGRNDVFFTLELLDHLAVQVCIDQQRIYATGMANGGLFTSQLVCSLADRFAAAVSVAGTYHPDSCEPARPVPYLAFHGTADDAIPYDGEGASTVTGDGESAEFFEQAVPDEFAEFASDFGCVDFEDIAFSESVTLRRWSGCAEDVEVGFYTVAGGGHTWPGSEVAATIEALGETTFEVDATAVAWEFFGRHTLAGPTAG